MLLHFLPFMEHALDLVVCDRYLALIHQFARLVVAMERLLLYGLVDGIAVVRVIHNARIDL